ncbi:MAG TPA: hypothetical protein VNF28_01980 [Candidatus Binataceae bacterium]|nr:hypothetical protein [Candidatus Binataceae bacterium]
MDAIRARIDAALEGAVPPPTGSGKSNADKPETHDINARLSSRAGSDTATAKGNLRVAEPVQPAAHPTTWRQSAPRHAPHVPCDCCASPQAFKRKHGLTPLQAYKREHWPMIAAWEEDRMDDYHRLSKERAALEKVRREALAYCTECHNPLVATEHGYQFCPYERAGQHAKIKAALRRPDLVVVSNSKKGAVGSLRSAPDRAKRAILASAARATIKTQGR